MESWSGVKSLQHAGKFLNKVHSSYAKSIPYCIIHWCKRDLQKKLITLNCYSEEQLIVNNWIKLSVLVFVWITKTSLETSIHSNPVRDLDRFNYCTELLTNLCWYHIKSDVHIAPTKIFYLPL